jgi:16S rRNA G966 N2-methylase RsmD
MNLHTVAHLDAISLLERIENASTTLVYFDPPTEVQQDAPDRRLLLSLYLHATCHSKRILRDNGVLVWHTLPESASNVRRTLDRVFGPQLFAQEIVLKHRIRRLMTNAPITDHTSLIMYSKTSEFHYKPPRRAVSEQTRTMYSQHDAKGPYRLADITASVNHPNLQFPWHNHTPPAGRSWRYTISKLEELYAAGSIQVSETKFPRVKVYLNEHPDEEIGSVWDDIDPPRGARIPDESDGQQSLALMNRIVAMVTQVDDLIVDPFCGTGTTLIAAEQSSRNWLAADCSLTACKQTIDRLSKQTGRNCVLLTDDEARRFPVQNTVAELIRALPPLADSIPTDTHELITSAESKTLEFKQTLSVDIRKNEKQKYIETASLKTIAAFLNSDGGTLVVGVSDNRDPVGIEDEINRFHEGSADKFLLHFKNLICSDIGPEFYPLLDFNLVPIDTKRVLRIDCKRSDRPCFIGEDFYVRTNPATDKLAGPTMLQYIKTRFPNLGA